MANFNDIPRLTDHRFGEIIARAAAVWRGEQTPKASMASDIFLLANEIRELRKEKEKGTMSKDTWEPFDHWVGEELRGADYKRPANPVSEKPEANQMGASSSWWTRAASFWSRAHSSHFSKDKE